MAIMRIPYNIKRLAIVALLTVIQLQSISADHGLPSTCWKCGSGGQNGDGSYKMCDWGGTLKDPEAVICCKPGSTSTYCQENDINICTKPKNEMGDYWYANCPGVQAASNVAKCTGTQVLKPQFGVENKWGVTGMGWQGQDESTWKKLKDPNFCWFRVNSMPLWTYSESTRTEVKFTIVQDMVVNVYKGNDIRSIGPSPTALNTAVVKVGDIFKMATKEDLIITAYPVEGSFDAKIEWSYEIKGEQLNEWLVRYYSLVKQGDKAEELEIIVISCAGLFVCLVFTMIACCIKSCCCSKSKKVDPNATLENENIYLNKNQATEQYNSKGNNFEGTQGDGLELESFQHSDTGGDDDGTTLPVPKVKKANKAQQDAAIREAYANPFKKHKVNKVNIMN